MKPAVYFAGFALVGLFSFSVIATPAPTFASESFNVQARQILPPGQSTCTELQVREVTAYVYNGTMDSFDVTIVDPSYVAVLGTAGNTSIPFNHMVRRVDPNGGLRIHVDTESVARGSTATLTLLSAVQQKTCLVVVTFGATGAGMPSGSGATPGTSGGVPTGGSASSGGGSNSAPTPSPSKGNTGAGSLGGGKSNSGSPSSSPVVGGVKDTLRGVCALQGAYRLWFILLAIFVIIAAFVALAEPPLSDRHIAIPIAAILTPFVLLLGFWFLLPSCRGTFWIPVMLVVIAAAGLYAALRNSPAVASVIQLPPAKK
ncbi:hypothetical protein HY970_01250 [Candidatus Kaiserbacteria bacterium]|nr:hypothetical protein [Candidatus Kaiserbacteria bacterium]